MSTTVQIRNVPSDLHRQLKARAAMEGMSLSEYLLREVRRALERPTLEEMGKRLAGRARSAACLTRRGYQGGEGGSVIVVDASAVLELLPQTTQEVTVARRIFAASETLRAPHLLVVEIARELRRYARSGAIPCDARSGSHIRRR